jgi:hypothetical protein
MSKLKQNKPKGKSSKQLTKYASGAMVQLRGVNEAQKRLIAKRPKLRRKQPEQALEQAIQTIPRITNETVAEHREEVLSSARKYIYPLKHSTHKIVTISLSLFAIGVVIFFSYCVLALYRFQSTSGFIYGVTQVIPFPVARVGDHFVSYENYLFEMRHYIHYYQTQQQVNFSSTSGQLQLNQFKRQAMNEVVDEVYIKQLANQNHVTVSSDDLNNEITLLQQQNRLGSNNKVFADVLKEFWGWSVNDFKRELKQQLLAEKVVTVLDVAANQRAQYVHSLLQNGGTFATLAQKYSDDTSTSANGGAYGFEITKSNRDISPVVVNELFSLKVGQYSGIINTGDGLEIVEVTAITGDEVEASHIFISFNNIDMYTNPLMAKNPPHIFIHLNK